MCIRLTSSQGTVNGGGYDCKKDKSNSFEGSYNGIWNKVSHHVEWIKTTALELGDSFCHI